MKVVKVIVLFVFVMCSVFTNAQTQASMWQGKDWLVQLLLFRGAVQY